MSAFTARGPWVLTGRDSRRIVSSLGDDGAANRRSNKNSTNVSYSKMTVHYSGRACLPALYMDIRSRNRVIWGGKRFLSMITLTTRSYRQSTYLHLLPFLPSPSREKQIKGSQRPDRHRHQTATPPGCSPSMPSPAPWSRTSSADPDLTAKSTFISSAYRGGSQQAVAIPALRGCQGRLMARSKAQIRAFIV